MENDTLMKTGAVAEALGVSRQHVVDLCERGDLPSIRVGTHRRIRRSDVDALLEAQSMTEEQRKQLWMHQAMLTHLLTRPEEVMGLARENTRRWSSMHRADGRTAEYLREWDSILAQGLEETVGTILSTSPRARELRQNSPFAGVLSQAERTQALRTFREKRTPEA